MSTFKSTNTIHFLICYTVLIGYSLSSLEFILIFYETLRIFVFGVVWFWMSSFVFFISLSLNIDIYGFKNFFFFGVDLLVLRWMSLIFFILVRFGFHSFRASSSYIVSDLPVMCFISYLYTPISFSNVFLCIIFLIRTPSSKS